MLPLPLKRCRESARTGDVDAPLAPVFWDSFETSKLRQDGRSRLRAPAGQSGISVRAVSDQRQVVGNGCRRNTELLTNASLVVCNSGTPIQLDDPCAADGLRQIFVRCADDDLFDSCIFLQNEGACG